MFSSKITFVTGKGGTGKSAVAAGIAWKSAQMGHRTLLVELSGPSALDGAELPPNLTVEELTGISSLKTFVKHYIKVPGLAELFFENRVMRSFLNVAPAVNELAILGKITSGVRKAGPAVNYDRIVVDTFATGHALALFKAPLGMSRAITSGPMGRDSRKIYEVLKDPAVVNYVIVTLPEALPVEESLELREGLRELVPQEPVLVVNKMELEDWQLSELEGFQGASVNPLENRWAQYLLSQKRIVEPLLRTVASEFPDHKQVPLLPHANFADLASQIGDALWTT